MSIRATHIASKTAVSSQGSLSFGIIASFIFHGLIILASIVTIPFWQKKTELIITPISVELVEIDDITRTNKTAPPAPKPKEVEKPEPPKEKPAPRPPKQTAETPPEPPKAKPKPKPKPKVKPKPKPVVKPKPEPKPKPKPKPKPQEKAEPEVDPFDSLLKNLAPDSQNAQPEEEKPKDKPKETSPDTGSFAPISERLTMSELDALKYQISKCWNVPSGIKYAENMAVEIRLVINKDGTVNRASVVDQGRYNRDTVFQAAADSALRAVRNPRCSPLELPADKYDRWKNTVMNFDPREML